VILMGLTGVMMLISWNAFRRAKAEQIQLEGIEELIRLRRWQEAGAMLQQLLGQPTRSPQTRVQGLIFLTGVLARYNRFDDAIMVQNYLLEQIGLDEGTAHGLRLARAMAMLRADHLFDADRAINELRRQVTRAAEANGRGIDDEDAAPPLIESETASPQSISAGLALVELYRDVKTGHPAEAIELFNSTLSSMREQLGQRVADAHVLVARAYEMLSRDAEAQASYAKATLLTPPEELHRRYPETAILASKYQPTAAPREAAA
jgi:tetratricopeptide (TPR) repeat protein